MEEDVEQCEKFCLRECVDTFKGSNDYAIKNPNTYGMIIEN